MMRGQIRSSVLWTLCLFCTATFSQSLPYTPTVILLPETSPSSRNIAYIFRQTDSTSTQALVSLNISSLLSTSNLKFESITADLPFLQDNPDTFVPTISQAGAISVYTGSCSTAASNLWRFTPSNTSVTGTGTWGQQTIRGGQDAVAPGGGYLSRALSFSTFAQANVSQTNLYVFGGMCPDSASNASTWQAAAKYSNRMRRLAPASVNEYTMGLPTSRGPPIPEAGFTITGLTPTSSNGSGVLTQQQDFVLVGGHTQTAFINMSQVAVWSMPQESWSFVAVSSALSSTANTELAVKSTISSIDSRSGHTTVLSEDGSKLIIYGGWVGDLNQAADPQLAVLSLGTGFGGHGEWQWTIPDDQPSGNSVYGHGAVMLPGNVMMVLGGFEISSGKSKRQAASEQVLFFNATSMTWTQDYTNPSYVAAIATKKATESNTTTLRKVGLGAGLGLGLAAVIAAIAVFCWYNRRLRRRRKIREKDLHALSMAVADHYSPERELGRRGGGFPWSNGGWNNRQGGADDFVYDSNSALAGYENLQSGDYGPGPRGIYPPVVRQIPRKPLKTRNVRGAYQPTPTYDFNPVASHGRANSLGTAGPIHPIYEADEEEARKSNEAIGMEIDRPDPFRDGQSSHAIPARALNYSMSDADPDASARSREREIREWVSDWAAADALMKSQIRSHSNAGRISPTRRAQLIAASTVSSMSAEEDSGRTASNLSERSIAVSTMSVSRSGSGSQGRSRSNSLRGFIANALSPFSTTATSTAASTTLTAVFDARHMPAPKSAGSTSSSFTTANTSFTALQTEGEGLLPRPDEHGSPHSSPTRSHHDPTPGSPSKSKPIGLGKARAGNSWFGSLRKAFIGEPGQDHDFHSVPSREPSPVRAEYSTGPVPRRAASTGATLWRRKQGKSDWEDSALDGPSTRSNTFNSDILTNRSLGTEDDDDWDIEQAVQNRVVQVMFTVPKEKLRVVNHDVGDDVSDVGSLKSKKGSGRSVALMENVVESAPAPVVEGKGKEKEIDAVHPQDEPIRSRSKGSELRPKTRVLEMVEDMERRHSPER